MQLSNRKSIILIIFLGTIMMFPFLGIAHLFDWDEINFAEISREMILTESFLRPQINFHPFWEKPPFFNWLQVLSMKIWGVNEYGARFPNAFIGLLTVLILYGIGKRQRNKQFGLLWALTYMGSILPMVYFKSGIIDPLFNFWIFLALYFLFTSSYPKKDLEAREKYFNPILAGAFTGLAVLTKGPAAILIIGLVLFVVWVRHRFRLFIKPLNIVLYLIALLIVTASWFAIETIQNGPWFVERFITYQIRLFSTEDAGHGGFPAYHFVVVLLGCFPASIWLIGSFLPKHRNILAEEKDFSFWMKSLLWVVLILFSIVQSKIVHYSSLAYFPVSWLSAMMVYKWIEQKRVGDVFARFLFPILSIFWIIVSIALPLLFQNIDHVKAMVRGTFERASMNAAVEWPWWTWIPAIILVLSIAIFLWLKNKKLQYYNAFASLFIGLALFTNAALIAFSPRIERFSQGAAIDFYKERVGEEHYLITHGFKSYAQYFYTQKQPLGKEEAYTRKWLYYGEIDRPVYIVSKINKADQVAILPDIIEIKRENGFVFFKRLPR